MLEAKHKVFDSLQTGGCRDFYNGAIQRLTVSRYNNLWCENKITLDRNSRPLNSDFICSSSSPAVRLSSCSLQSPPPYSWMWFHQLTPPPTHPGVHTELWSSIMRGADSAKQWSGQVITRQANQGLMKHENIPSPKRHSNPHTGRFADRGTRIEQTNTNQGLLHPSHPLKLKNY